MRVSAVLIDIDGVLTVSWRPLQGAAAALRWLRAAGLPLALVTNTTSRPRASIARVLAEAGFPVSTADILTAPAIAAAYLRENHPGARCLLLNSGQITEDLAGITIVRGDDPGPVDVVLVGGAGPEFSYQALNRALGHLQGGAVLVAMHRGMYWRTSDGLQLDSGAFVAGLEQAAGVEAEVVGKPAAAFFATALAHLGAGAAGTLMVGDDIETDVLAAQRQGLTGVLVKTGKYLPSAHRHASGTPDHVLSSFADLPALLENLSLPPFDPDEAWGTKAVHRVSGTVNGCRVRVTIAPGDSGWAFTLAYLRYIDATTRRPDLRASRIEEVVGLLAEGIKERPRP